jgi:hypothetical protein
MMGELVQQTTIFGQTSQQFNLGSQARGIYIVWVAHGDNIYLEKVIRQ